MPGAEPFSAPGGPHGALVLHGFTGTPQSMRGLAEAFAAAGYAVELPLLPGHGTSVDDMATTTFADWSEAVARAYDELAAALRARRGGRALDGRDARGVARRPPPGDRRARRDQRRVRAARARTYATASSSWWRKA